MPERVMDESLKLYEGKYGLVMLEDPELVKQVRTQFHSKVGARVASDMTPEQRQSRALRGGYGKAARRLGITVDEYIERKAAEDKKS